MAEWTIEWNNQAIKNNPNFEVDGITIFKISDTIYNIDELSAARVTLSDGTESITISCIGVTNIANGATGLVFADFSYQFVVVAAIVSENSSDYEPGLYVGDVLEGTNLDITMSYIPATFCLYNGVKLPDVNTVWNKEKYPYAFIVTEIVDNITTAWLYLTANPVYIAPIEPDLPDLQIPAGGYAQYICVDSLDAAENNPFAGYNYWKASILTGDNATSFDAPKDGETAWSNHDVYNVDGALYLTASNPIPIGGSLTFTIDKTSFLAGYKVGAELRRLRMNKGGSDSNYKHRIVWDCTDTEGKTSYNLADEYLFYKVSDLVPESDELIGGRLTVRASNGSETEEMIIDITADSFNPKNSAGYMAHYFIVRTSMEEFFIYATPETGIWFVDLLSLPDAEGAVSGSIILEW